MALPALATGAAIALRERFSASQFMPDIRRYGATFFSTAGRALAYVLDVPATPEDRDHKVKFGLAAEASPSDVEQFDARFGIRCFGGYASSENAITLARAPGMPDDALGVAQNDADVAIIDPESGIECPRAALSPGGELLNSDVAIGEIVGRNVADRFEGYYKNPDATEARLRGGWFWSGDLGYRDADGVFFFAGRTDDWLRVDSENFAAAPVERVLARFPGARGVAVFAVPDERTADDQVMAALEMVDGVRFDPDELTVFLDAQPDLGTKWSPRYVRITTLPVGATNKVDKPTLRRERWYTDDPVYWRSGRSRAYVPFTPDDRHALEARFQQHGRSVHRR
jgi:fatty-acyl-CoA synthase